MAAKLNRLVLGLLSLPLLASACSKDEKKFNLSKPHQERQLIVTFQKGTLKSAALQNLESVPADAVALNGESYLLTFRNDGDLESAAEAIAGTKGVKGVEANVIYKLYEKTPNDTEFSKLYGMNNSGQSGGSPGADIGALKAWDSTTGSKDVLVGIIDSGMDYNHPDLKDNVWSNPGETGLDANGNDKRTNGIDDDGNGFVDDWHGWDFSNNDNDPMDDNSHGTHVAGTIGGVGNNANGIVGVNWAVTMVPIKVFSGAGDTTTDILVKGIDYATKLGVFVSNNSWGGGVYSDAIFGAIQKASEKNILFCAAAGNDSENNDAGDHYPANYDLPNIISVASINRKDQLSVFSDYGPTTVDVAAPGEDIYSTLPNASYGTKSGTSMATPHVTGAVALLRSHFPELNPLAIKEKLLNSSISTPALAGRIIHGRINVANALEVDTVPPAIVSGLDVTATGLNNVSVTWNLSGDDGDAGEASQYLIRMSAAPITTEAEWAAATAPTVAGLNRLDAVYTASIINLPYNYQGYLAIRASDNVGNLSGISENINFALKAVVTLWSEDNEGTTKWETFGSPWAVTKIGDLGVISDSPSGFYENNINKSAVTQQITLEGDASILEMRMKYELEKGYDFGYIELSSDGGSSWSEIAKIDGTSDWTTASYDVKGKASKGIPFRLRLRIQTDQSVNYQGWDIDSLRFLGQSE